MGQPRVTLVHKHFKTLDDEVMRRRLLRLLKSVGWDIRAAAEQIGITRQALYKIIATTRELASAVGAVRGGKRYIPRSSA